MSRTDSLDKIKKVILVVFRARAYTTFCQNKEHNGREHKIHNKFHGNNT